ncbi:MAG: anti-sigma factor antagonist [Spirochaetota bacterium]
MEVTDRIIDNVLLIEFSGDLVTPDAMGVNHTVIDMITESSVKRVILSLEKVFAMDSIGLGVLMNIRKFAKKNHIFFAMVGVSENIKNTFNYTEINEYLNVHESLDKLL